MKSYSSKKLKSLLLVFSLFILCTIMIYYFTTKVSRAASTTKTQVSDFKPQLVTEAPQALVTSSDITLDPEPNVSSTPTESKIANIQEDKSLKEINSLVELIELDDSFVLDLKYATDNNFTGRVLYTNARCFIHKNTAKKLISANNEFKTLGYRIKVFDVYRPYSVTKLMWDLTDNKNYVANPEKGSNHNRGASVDITLIDKDGNELSMPSEFDEFSKRSHLNYADSSSDKIKNRELLGSVMVKHGFRRISHEWWHFDDTDFRKYPILDIPFEEFDI